MSASNLTRRRALMAVVSPVLVVLVIAALASSAQALGPPANWVTTMYNSANNQETGATIKVQVATTGTYSSRNGWGGCITGIYYRSSTGDIWGENMIDNTEDDYGQNLQLAMYQGPASAYFASDPYWPDWPWNPTQAGDRLPNPSPSPAYITGSGLSPVPWISIRTWPYDWAKTHEECVQLDQLIYVYPTQIEINYSISGRSGYSCSHPVMFHDAPVIFTSRYDPSPLNDGKLYTGLSPWTGDTSLTTVDQETDWHQVYASEDWIGLYRSGGGTGLMLAYPERTRYQPYCHHWSFHHDTANSQIRSRPYFDINPVTGETISWRVYVIPGIVGDARQNAYCLLPHDRWEFNLGTANEGWIAWNQLSNLRVVGGQLKGTSTGTDPYMYSLDQLGFASDSIYGITIRMSVTAGSKAQVFYTTEEDQIFSESKSTGKFNITADGQFHTYTRQLNNIAGWSGKTIKRLRLDPTDAATGTDGIKVDYMRLTRYSSSWEFNTSGNNEGWMPVTKQLKDRIWPGNVTGGSLIVDSSGMATDTYTNPDTTIYPTLLGPYPMSIAPTAGYRYAEVRLKFTGTGYYNARLRYTLTTDDKQFDYHGAAPDWPDNFLVTRFDLAGHSAVWQNSIPANEWVVLNFTLPSSGTIDQLELVPTDRAGTVEIDYIEIVYI